jgi:predicted RNA-binding protein YlxR (DUF448 family)
VSDNAASIDFSALSQQAATMMDDVSSIPGAPAAEQPAATADSTPEPTSPAEDKLLSLDPTAKVKVKVDGEEQVVTVDEALKGYSRTAYLTKRTQAIAEQQRQIEAERQQFAQERMALQQLQADRAHIEQVLSNREIMAQYVAETFPDLMPQPQPRIVQGPDGQLYQVPEPAPQVRQQPAGLSPQQAQYLFQQQQELLEQQMEQRLLETEQKIQNAQETAKYSESISNNLNQIFAKNPVLKAVDGMEELIRFNVAKMNPQTIGEAIEAFNMVSQGYAEAISSSFTNMQKANAAKKAVLKQTAIEPPGGMGITPQSSPSYRKDDGSLDWNKLRNAAENYLG